MKLFHFLILEDCNFLPLQFHICVLPEISKNRLIEIEIRLDIEQAVDRLPEEIKETAIFFFFQEIKKKEIVDLLNRRSKELSVEYSAI